MALSAMAFWTVFSAACLTSAVPGDESAKSLDSMITALERMTTEIQALEVQSKGAELRVKKSEAAELQNRAIELLEEKQRQLTGQKRRLERVAGFTKPQQIMLQCSIVEVRDLDEKLLKAVCERTGAESLNFSADDPLVSGPAFYSAKAEKLGRIQSLLEQRRVVTVRSRPSLLAVDGKIAEITVGDVVTLPTPSVGSQTRQETIGLVVSLIPRIEDDRQVALETIVSNSTITNSRTIVEVDQATGKLASVPSIATKRAQSILAIPEGRTLMVAVRTTEPTDELEPSTTTLLFVTPSIVPPAEDAPKPQKR